MAAAHPFGAFVGCRFKRIRCVSRINVKRESVCVCVCGGGTMVCWKQYTGNQTHTVQYICYKLLIHTKMANAPTI